MQAQLVINIPGGQLLFEDVAIVNKSDVDAYVKTYSDLKLPGLQSVGIDRREESEAVRAHNDHVAAYVRLEGLYKEAQLCNQRHVQQRERMVAEAEQFGLQCHLIEQENIQLKRENSELNVENARIHKLIALSQKEKDDEVAYLDEQLVQERLVHSQQMQATARTVARLEQEAEEYRNRIARQLTTIDTQGVEIRRLEDEAKHQAVDLDADAANRKLDAIRALVPRLRGRLHWVLKYADDRGVRFPKFASHEKGVALIEFASIFGLPLDDVEAMARKKFTCPAKLEEIILHPDNAERLSRFLTPTVYLEEIANVLS